MINTPTGYTGNVWDTSVAQPARGALAGLPAGANADQKANYTASVSLGRMTTAPKTEVSTLSTDKGQQVLDSAQTDHSADMARITAANANLNNTKTDTPEKPVPAAGALSYDEAKTLGVDLNTATFDPTTNTYLPSTEVGQKKQVTDKLKSDEADINSAFSGFAATADASTQNLINSITAMYGAQIEAMKEQNRRSLGTLSSFGVRQGTSRYAGEVQQGLLSAEERAGLERINNITAQMSSKIAEANSNLTDKKYQLFLKNREEISTLRKDAQKTLIDIQDKAIKRQEETKKAEIQSSRDSAIAGLMEQGVTDPTQILGYLNFKQDGTPTGGNFTAKEVADSVKSLAPEGDLKSLTGTTRNFYILKQKGMLPDSVTSLPEGEQLFSYLRQEKAASTIYKNNSKNPLTPEPQTTDVSAVLNTLSDKTPRDGGYSILGADGYVDPFVYKQLYDNWTGPGFNYSPQDFVKHFPPKNYINPTDNQYLPSYLQTTAKVPSTNTTTDKTYRRPPASIIGQVRALKLKNAPANDITNFITVSGYDPNDAAFK